MEKHRKKLIKNAAVFDGHSSGLAQGKKIVIEDDIVTEITADEVSEENFDEVFDGTGMVAMPGMTDAHVHMGCLFAKGEFPVDYATVLTVAKCKDALMAGFTTFRDAGSVSEGLKLAFDEGVLPGPRIYPCGAYISQTCGMEIRSMRIPIATSSTGIRPAPFWRTGCRRSSGQCASSSTAVHPTSN